MSLTETKKGILNFNITMPRRKPADAERWQAIGLIKVKIMHRRVGGKLNCIKIN
jgi:hypothetical protein